APRHPLPHPLRGRPGRQRGRVHCWRILMEPRGTTFARTEESEEVRTYSFRSTGYRFWVLMYAVQAIFMSVGVIDLWNYYPRLLTLLILLSVLYSIVSMLTTWIGWRNTSLVVSSLGITLHWNGATL